MTHLLPLLPLLRPLPHHLCIADTCMGLPTRMHLHLQEVWLLRRSARKGEPGVLGAHRCDGPFDGTTLPSTVDWPGVVVIDIAAKVRNLARKLECCNETLDASSHLFVIPDCYYMYLHTFDCKSRRQFQLIFHFWASFLSQVEAVGTGAFWIKACGRVPLSFDEVSS